MNNICLNIECDNTIGSYSFISNFLKKLTLHEYLNEEELKKVTYTMYASDKEFSEIIKLYNSGHKKNIERFDGFRKNIYNYNFAVAIHAHFSSDNDITELINFVLIRQFYNDIKIYLIISAEDSFYFKASQYLTLLSQKEMFHNYIYFNDVAKPKRLQQKGVGALRNYVPILLIEGDDFLKNILALWKTNCPK